ncbi:MULTISPECIES: peptidase inhibitor family I36 protein [Kitasatospora]|uniref:Peptidase inhibitor n=1 Tax=Kitasatospora cystarginea TaxID=58350 RepID=A0ABN3DE79_9ACTN
MRRTAKLAVTLTTLLAALSAGPAATAATEPGPATATSRGLSSFSCDPGHFCIYSDWSGGGTRCQWTESRNPNTADDCSFIRKGWPVRSVWNGTGHRVQYYTQTNYKARVGSTAAGSGGNLMGNYQIRSFQPQ